MDRLTTRDEIGRVIAKCESCEKPGHTCSVYNCRDMMKDRLADYEDTDLTPEEISELKSQYDFHWLELFLAEQDSRLIVLPCKVGDTVWAIRQNPWEGKFVRDFTVSAIGARVLGDRTEIIITTTKDDVYGKTVFLTREEAEAALEEKK